VIDLNRVFYGIDTHLTDQQMLAGTALQLVGGFAYDDLEESRLGLLNYVGTTLGGRPGAARRGEPRLRLAEYLQAQWIRMPGGA